MKNILIDTGFWFALSKPTDQYYQEANKLLSYLSNANIIIPYPTLYETINTKFVKKRESMEFLNKHIVHRNTSLINDDNYREVARKLTFELAQNTQRHLSLVDVILRLMLDDENLKIDYFITFNSSDFSDVCRNKNIEILYS